MSDSMPKALIGSFCGSDSAARGVLASLLASGDYADLTIKCGDQTFRVHKAIVCSHSPWFRNTFKPDAFSDSKTNAIVLAPCTNNGDGVANGDDPDALAAMIDFFYGLGPRDTSTGVPAFDPFFIVKKIVLAKKYQVISMELDLVPKFAGAVSDQNFSDAATFAKVLKYIYLNITSDSGLKDRMLDFALGRRQTILANPAVQKLLNEIPDISVDVVKRLSDVCTWTVTSNTSTSGKPTRVVPPSESQRFSFGGASSTTMRPPKTNESTLCSTPSSGSYPYPGPFPGCVPKLNWP